jgi:hypothetical protein
MQPIEVIREVIERIAAKDLEGVLSFISDDCTISMDTNQLLVQGKDNIRTFYQEVFANNPSLTVKLLDNFTVGSVFAAREINQGFMVDGKATDVDSVWVYQIENDKLNMMHAFSPSMETREALLSV